MGKYTNIAETRGNVKIDMCDWQEEKQCNRNAKIRIRNINFPVTLNFCEEHANIYLDNTPDRTIITDLRMPIMN